METESEVPMSESTKRPVHEVRYGSIKAVIWQNATNNGAMHNVTVARIYKDGDQWKEASGFGAACTEAAAMLKCSPLGGAGFPSRGCEISISHRVHRNPLLRPRTTPPTTTQPHPLSATFRFTRKGHAF